MMLSLDDIADLLDRGMITGALADSLVNESFAAMDARAEPAVPCDCGAAKVKTTHSHWCSTVAK